MSAIELSREQAMLAEIASRFFREKWPVESVRVALTSELGFDRDLWREMVEVGWNGLAVPEEAGGSGLGAIELTSLVEVMGKALFASPFVTTQLVVQGLSHAGEQGPGAVLSKEWLPRLAAGAIGTLALVEPNGSWDLERVGCRAEVAGGSVRLRGTKTFVLDAEAADVLLVSASADGEPALVLVEREALAPTALEREVVIDETRRSYRLSLEGLEVSADHLVVAEDARRALRAIRDLALLLTAAEAAGGTAGVLDLVVGYLRSRRQFGRLIGSYQALKHPTVDILIGLERMRSHVYHAATVFAGAEAEVALRMAKACASEGFAFAGDRAIQFHGGFGFTYECDAQLFLRRALWCQYHFGDALHHRQALAELVL